MNKQIKLHAYTYLLLYKIYNKMQAHQITPSICVM
jgi:hypothetical protein